MNNWPKIVIPTLVVTIIGSIYLLFVWHGRQDSGVAPKSRYQDVSKDDLVVMKAYFPRYFEDTERIAGTSVWMKNGYVIPYFAYSNDHVDFTKRIGVVPSLQRLDVKKIVKAALPAGQYDGMTSGKQQAFAVFATPGSDGLFAVPIGYIDGDKEGYYSDALFFYDDPHTIYDYWPKEFWTAIDAHQVKPGMSELQARLAVGQKMDAHGKEEGERTIVFDQAGKHWTVRFENKRAVSIQSDNATVAKSQ